MKRSQNTLNSRRIPGSFSTSLTTNSQIIRSIMAATISSFEKAPSPNRIEVGGSNFFSYHQNQNRSGNIIGKSKFKSSFLFIPSTSLVNARISKCTWFSKKYIPCKNFPKAPFNREGEIFCKKLGKINKRPSCVEHCSWISVSFHRTLLSNFFTSGRKYYSRGKVTGERKINEILEKGAIIKVNPSPDQFCSNIFTVPKKDGGNRQGWI